MDCPNDHKRLVLLRNLVNRSDQNKKELERLESEYDLDWDTNKNVRELLYEDGYIEKYASVATENGRSSGGEIIFLTTRTGRTALNNKTIPSELSQEDREKKKSRISNRYTVIGGVIGSMLTLILQWLWQKISG